MKMIKYIPLFVFFLVATISLVSSGNIADVKQLQYVTSWIPAYCNFPTQPTNICKPNLPEIFVTHGIWPADVRGETVSGCPGNPISDSMFDKYKDQLSRRWPAIMAGRTDYKFWGHEYNLHGICSSLNQADYLNYVIGVSARFNTTTMLSEQGIIKSSQKKYSKNDIQNAIEKKIGRGFNIYLSCKQVNPTLYYLREMTICMYNMKSGEVKDYTFISCPLPLPSASAGRNNCGGNKPGEENIMLITGGVTSEDELD